MAVTVGWLARQPHLGLTVVAGAGHADREILWAHAIELADPAPYLSGGELVMTTGITVGADRQEQFEYVERLVGADAAALAFDTGTTFRAVPEGILAAGDALGLPVLRVPASTPFIAITRAVIDAITAEQVKSVQRTVELQERLVRETLRGGIPALVTTLARALGATAMVLSTDGRLLAGDGPDLDRVGAVAAAAVRRAKTGSSSRVVADGEGWCTLQALRAASVSRGWLAVRSALPLSGSERLLLAHAVSLVNLELEKPTRVLDAEQRLRVGVAQALIAAPDSVDPTVLRYFGFEPDTPTVAVALTGVGPALPAESHIQRMLHEAEVPFLMCPWQDDIVVVVPAGQHACVAALHRSLRGHFGPDVRAGISSPGRLQGLEVRLNQARVAMRSGPGDALRHFDELGAFDAILADRTPGQLTLLCEVLRPLDGHDLLPTLTEFLEHNGHLENAAAALGVHRHTMRNRLGRITELLGCSLDSADTRAMLLLAVRAREMLPAR